MTPLNTNMRHIKRIPGEGQLVYTLGDSREIPVKEILCNYCGWRDDLEGYDKCSIFAEVQGRKAIGVKTVLKHCRFFQPILMFKDSDGRFDGTFNTFRLGSSWYNRVSPGSVCVLYATATNQIFGKAVVTETHHGSLEEMCEEHAINNHAIESGLNKEQAAALMYAAIGDAYAPLMGDAENMKSSVIYLRQYS